MKLDALQPIREALYVDDTERDAWVLAGMIRDLFRTESKRCDEIKTLRAEASELRATLARTDETLRIVRESFTVQCDAKDREIARLRAALESIATTAVDFPGSGRAGMSAALTAIETAARAALDGAR